MTKTMSLYSLAWYHDDGGRVVNLSDWIPTEKAVNSCPSLTIGVKKERCLYSFLPLFGMCDCVCVSVFEFVATNHLRCNIEKEDFKLCNS